MIRFITAIAALIAFCLPSNAQPSTIHGHVTDAESGRPIPGAHVFLAESLTGTTTDSLGYYQLRGLTPGAQRVVVSIVGYETMHAEIVAESGRLYRFDAALTEDVIEMENIDVVDYYDDRWRKYLDFFLRTFLGETENASQASISNLGVLHMDTTRLFLSAWSWAPLEISNPALGYDVTFYLQRYESDGSDVAVVGDPMFREMEPESEQQMLDWEIARCQAYMGSRRHFLRTLANRSSRTYGFEVSLLPSRREVTERRIVRRGSSDEMRLLRLNDPLEVTYRHAAEYGASREAEPYGIGVSFISSSPDPVEFDERGRLLTARRVMFRGTFSVRRMGDLLPYEYDPPQGVELPDHCETVLRLRHGLAEN
jgi:hypothetical protein